jgi:hypothetical protein
MSEEKDQLRKLIMIISDLRAKDSERYESHVAFMNETVKMIKAIANQMNEHWQKVQESLTELNKTIETSLNALLTGINPKGLRETSEGLKEIMDTMNKSVQSMNLENVMRELKAITTGEARLSVDLSAPISAVPISAGMSYSQSGPKLKPPPGTAQTKEEEEIYGYVPESMKKKKKKDEEEEPHLMKPSDLFGKKE